jgi:hypothetical protein
MMRIARVVAALALSAAALGSVAVAAEGNGAVVVTRYILSYSGPVTLWRVERGTQRLAPKNGLALQVADCITLESSTTSGAVMTVVVDGSEVAVNAAHPHYCVSAAAGQNPVLAAMARSFASLAGVFHDAETDYNAQSVTSAVSRGGPFTPHLNVPLLGQDDQRLGAGTRALALAWVAGTAPYTIALSKVGASAPLVRGRAERARVVLDAVPLAPGTYVVDIRDAANLLGEKRFTVVPAGDLPQPSADIATVLADPATPENLRAAFDAARLMNDASDTFRLEAYQRLIGHEDSALAKRLIYQLENDG